MVGWEREEEEDGAVWFGLEEASGLVGPDGFVAWLSNDV